MHYLALGCWRFSANSFASHFRRDGLAGNFAGGLEFAYLSIFSSKARLVVYREGRSISLVVLPVQRGNFLPVCGSLLRWFAVRLCAPCEQTGVREFIQEKGVIYSTNG